MDHRDFVRSATTAASAATAGQRLAPVLRAGATPPSAAL